MDKESCETRIDRHLKDRIEDIKQLLSDGDIFEYGLGFDYVAFGTFNDQDAPYFRWQLSWGGPSDEFRFFVAVNGAVYKIEYWFLDWFDGANRELYGTDFYVLKQIFDTFDGCGLIEGELERGINRVKYI